MWCFVFICRSLQDSFKRHIQMFSKAANKFGYLCSGCCFWNVTYLCDDCVFRPPDLSSSLSFFQVLCDFACYAGFHLPPPLPWKRFSKLSSTYWFTLSYWFCYCIISFQYSLKFLFLFTLWFSFCSFTSYLSSFVANIMFSWILTMIPFWFFNTHF